MTLGRDASNDVVLVDPAVSRLHAVLERSDDRWVVRDLGSRNGTYVNGVRIPAERVLFRDDQLRLGGTLIDFRAGNPGQRTTEITPDVVRAEHDNVFRRDGDYWSLTYLGTTVHLREKKGLRDIAHLLARPGSEIPTIQLIAAPPPANAKATRAAAGDLTIEGAAGEVLDQQARTQYGARLVELEGEIADADANNDPVRASNARDEREFLLSELRAAVGLGGHSRTVLDPAERARKAVTWRIRDAISHIEASHRELGRHLRRSVRTGSYCVYDPPSETIWKLE